MPEINRKFDQKNKRGEENSMYSYNPLVNMQCIKTFHAPGVKLTFDFQIL